MIRYLGSLSLLAAVAASTNTTLGGCYLGTLGGCSTSPTSRLTGQIMAELNSLGYSFVSMPTNWVHFNDDAYNGLQASAANALVGAAQARNDYITLNDAWRSSAQQYLLYKWYGQGGCGITACAKPGQSNHESGLAIDTSYYDYWMGTLQNYGWRWYGGGDVVHFDYVNGGSDCRSANLLAFQRLWNRHNPGSWIDEDGIYGPMTANAFYNTPCEGW